MRPKKNHLIGSIEISIIILVTTVISIVPYLTSKAEHTMLYKFHKNVHIKTSKIIII